MTRGFCLRGWQMRLLVSTRMDAKSSRHRAACAIAATSQGRRMLQNDRENLELDKLMNEIRKLVAERKKLVAEEKKMKWETYFYPVAVVAGMLTATAALIGLSLKL